MIRIVNTSRKIGLIVSLFNNYNKHGNFLRGRLNPIKREAT